MQPPATLVYFQLKYCERCGALWLRPGGLATPYCPGCEDFMAALPARPRRSRRGSVSAAGPPLAPAHRAADDAVQLISGCAS